MNILLDTDLGSDVDDALALSLIVGSPELHLSGVATVYGDTHLRAEIARKYLRLAGVQDSVPVVAGGRATLSGREIWWTGHEGVAFDDLSAQPVTSGTGVDLLRATVAANPGQIDILAIGPLTNIAEAIQADPAFESNVRTLIVMGGDFRDDRIPEHNFECDVEAAQRVFGSKLNIVLGALDLTLKVELGPQHLEAIAESGPLGAALASEIEIWWKFIGSEGNNPHDPILALWLADQQLFSSTRNDVHIDDDGKSWATPNPKGRVLVLDTTAPEAVADEIVRRIVNASVQAARLAEEALL